MKHRQPKPHDQALRQQLKQSLEQAPPADHEALQARILAQWQQRHPATAHALSAAGGPGLQHEHDAQQRHRKARWALALGLLLAGALALGWLNRPDPVLEELMQPDVLSQIGLGEL